MKYKYDDKYTKINNFNEFSEEEQKIFNELKVASLKNDNTNRMK